MRENLTRHAILRMSLRGVSQDAIELAIDVCKPIYSKGAEFYFIGKKIVKRYIDIVPTIEKYEGLVVVINSRNGRVLTVYKNKNFTKNFRGYYV